MIKVWISEAPLYMYRVNFGNHCICISMKLIQFCEICIHKGKKLTPFKEIYMCSVLVPKSSRVPFTNIHASCFDTCACNDAWCLWPVFASCVVVLLLIPDHYRCVGTFAILATFNTLYNVEFWAAAWVPSQPRVHLGIPRADIPFFQANEIAERKEVAVFLSIVGAMMYALLRDY